VKQRDLLKKLEDAGWWMLREGANHIVYTNGQRCEPIPRHREVNELLAKAILKRAGIQ